MQASPVRDLQTRDQIESRKNFLIFIIGNNQLQNRLVAYYLENEMGLECATGSCISEVCEPPHLVLMDFRGNDSASIRSGLSRDNVFLFNADHDCGNDFEYSVAGRKDIFYCSDSLEHIRDVLRGIIERRIKSVISTSPKTNLQYLMQANERQLSRRETEILQLVITGISNKDIAEKLFISIHTVKTHLYNIYKTLKIRNRVEAVSWAQKAHSVPARRVQAFPDSPG